ncbi:MAG: hypothetical protein RL589_593 [Actinomycetota bacterium]|jgi:hypothetical protein
MKINSEEKFLSKIMAIGAGLTTVFIISGNVTDPVNTPKLLVLGIFALASFALVLGSALKSRLQSNFLLLTLLFGFIIQMMLSSTFSKAPKSQIMYGTYGRNNGLIMYVFLISVFCAALCLRRVESFTLIIKAFVLSGLVNLTYNLWVLVFGDFISWNNPYGNILGTFGNPNFIGAFLGMLFSCLSALVLDKEVSNFRKIIIIFGMILCAYEIIESSAVQGRVVAIFGSMIVLFMYLRSRFSSKILVAYSVIVCVLGSLSLAGALQKGPLSAYIYKNSVSLRGQYWKAAWNTGEQNPWFGVGMDSFGDWYRRARDLRALELPGVNTVVNTAHNVPLDIFAFGGWPLLSLYVAIFGWSCRSAIQIIMNAKKFDTTAAVIISVWSGYQLQSIISINQIGLAVWGWLLSGLVIAYEISTRSIDESSSERRKVTQKVPKNLTTPVRVIIFSFVGALAGLVISIPPFASDLSWRNAQVKQSLPLIEESMTSSYFNPQNTQRYIDNIDLLERSQLYDLSRKYALEAVSWNPNSFDLWKLLYLIKESTDSEKLLAIENMRRLDPLNPEVTATQ